MSKVTRRDILRLGGLSVLGAFIAQACGFSRTELQVQSPVKMPEDIVSGRDNWYATVCRECPAGCGTIVRVIEGRAIKIEGNPLHPLNRGKLCARGQAALQALYHPDRLRRPLRRTGEQGSAQFRETDWEDALRELTERLSQLREQRQADTVLLITPPLRGHLARVTGLFTQAYGGQQMAYEPHETTTLRAAVKQVFGSEALPVFDIASSGYVLSFGADFLSTWLSPVHYGLAYGEFRQGSRPRGTLVQIEPRFSLTAANADEWVFINPGSEGIMALSLAQVLIAEGLADPEAAAAFTRGLGGKTLDEFQPAKASPLTGVPEDRIRELARNFARPPGGGPSLALPGASAAAHSNGLFNLTAILALNGLGGRVSAVRGVNFNPEPPLPELATRLEASPLMEWQRLVERMATGQPKPVNMVLAYDANPVYGLPEAAGFSRGLKQVPFVVSFASFLDETAAQADLVLPVHVPLEEWGTDIPEPGPGFQTVSFQQPVVNPAGDTREFADVLLTIGRALGPDMAQAMPDASSLELLQRDSRKLFELKRGSVSAPDFPTFWNKLLQNGGWWDKMTAGTTPPVGALSLPKAGSALFAGSPESYPYHLIPFPSLTLGEGNGAHLPWLQATPDPLTTVVWQTWAEIGPETAASLSLKEGDVVRVISPHGDLEVPVYIVPLMPPGIVGIPLGQGHFSYTRYAEGRGANVASILAPVAETETGALAWAATRVSLEKVGKQAPLPKFEGVVAAVPLPGSEIVPVLSASALDSPGQGETMIGQAGPDRFKWAMVVDLDRCSGCQACVVACQAENNLPLNQEEWFHEHRAFEWIRVERYWAGAFPSGRAHFIPILCQHCANAPCEPVCPVYATSHNEQGLNIQTYPRCIGTRFCANNCPYQVRFFNFWPALWPQSLRNHLNPDVTVRPRGIIEKCTFCVQRINRGLLRAKQQGRAVQDGEIVPACVQACPTNALVFGNILDPQSRVSRLARDRRGYRLLGKLGTEPSVIYLKKVVPDGRG